MIFAGLSAFPLTPMDESGIDETAYVHLVARLAGAGVDSIGALGSTGNHAYLTREERSRVARLTREQAIKVPAPPAEHAATHIPRLRALIGSDAVVGVSGDALAAPSLLAGSPAWFSVIAGLLPEPALAITRAAQKGQATRALAASDRLSGFWKLFATHGSLRVVAATAARLGLTRAVNLPRPLLPLDDDALRRLDDALDHLDPVR